MSKKQKPQKEIFEGNKLIKEFLLKSKLLTLEQLVEKLIQKLETIDHKLCRIENHIDSHSIQKIYDLDIRISDLESFQNSLRDAL